MSPPCAFCLLELESCICPPRDQIPPALTVTGDFVGRTTRLDRLERVLAAAKAVGCTCPMRQGHPLATHHSADCAQLLAAVKEAEA